MTRLLLVLSIASPTLGCGGEPSARPDDVATVADVMPDAEPVADTTTLATRADTLVLQDVARDSHGPPETSEPEPTCTPSCPPGAECGGDGCGGSCGACAEGETCNIDRCVCFAECGARECGLEPVCGRSCGQCDVGETCADGTCVGGVVDACLGGGLADDCGMCAPGAHCWDFATLDGATLHACGSTCERHADCPDGWQCQDHAAGRACAPRAEERCEGRAWVYQRCGRSVGKRADCSVACCEQSGEATCVGEDGIGCRTASFGAYSLGILVFSCDEGWLVEDEGAIVPGSVLDESALDCARYCELTAGVSGVCAEEVDSCSGGGPDGEALCQGPVVGPDRLEVGRCVCDGGPPPEPERFGMIRLWNPTAPNIGLCATSPSLSDVFWMFAYASLNGGASSVLGWQMQLDLVVPAGTHVLDVDCCLATGYLCPGTTGHLCTLETPPDVICGCVSHQVTLEVGPDQVVEVPLCGTL